MTPAQAAADAATHDLTIHLTARIHRRHRDDGIDLYDAENLAVTAVQGVRDDGWAPGWGLPSLGDPSVPLSQRWKAWYAAENADILRVAGRMGGAR